MNMDKKILRDAEPHNGLSGVVPTSLAEALAEWERAQTSRDRRTADEMSGLMTRLTAGLTREDRRLLYKKAFADLGIRSITPGLDD